MSGRGGTGRFLGSAAPGGGGVGRGRLMLVGAGVGPGSGTGPVAGRVEVAPTDRNVRGGLLAEIPAEGPLSKWAHPERASNDASQGQARRRAPSGRSRDGNM